MGCACRAVTAFLEAQAKTEAQRTWIHELSRMAHWSAKEWLAHFDAEEDPKTGIVVPLQKNPKTADRARAILVQHATFRRTFASGRTPSRAALLAHALMEDRALSDAGLVPSVSH